MTRVGMARLQLVRALVCGIVVSSMVGCASKFKHAEERVRYALDDPKSAEFRNEVQKPGYVCGEVNAKNRAGGYEGFRRFYFEEAHGGVVTIDPDHFPSADERKMFPPLMAADYDTNEFDKVYNRVCLGRTGPTDTEMLENGLNLE